jgi:hypothetical protein
MAGGQKSNKSTEAINAGFMSQHTEVSEYLVRTSVRRHMDRSLSELRAETQLMGDSERLLYAVKVGDVASVHHSHQHPGCSPTRDQQQLQPAVLGNPHQALLQHLEAAGLQRQRVLARCQGPEQRDHRQRCNQRRNPPRPISLLTRPAESCRATGR